jgi:hypothetical protein
LAAAERCAAVRREAAPFACCDSAFRDTVVRGSRFKAFIAARDLALLRLGFLIACPAS